MVKRNYIVPVVDLATINWNYDSKFDYIQAEWFYEMKSPGVYWDSHFPMVF